MRSKSFFYIATLSSLLLAAPASAQDGQLLAYESSQKDSITSVDDDINAALAALSEVNAILDAQKPAAEEKVDQDIIDVEAIVAAANAAKPAETPVPETVEIAKPAKEAPKPIIAAVDKAPDVQTAPTKDERAQTVTAKAETTPEPKPEAKPEPAKEAPKPVIAAVNKAPNVQTAPTKDEKTHAVTAKAETTPDPKPEAKPEPAKEAPKPVIAAVNKAQNVQTAPTKDEKSKAVTAKTKTTPAPRPVAKPEPAKEAPNPIIAANNKAPNPQIAPDGSRVTQQNPQNAPTPNTAKAAHTLSMSYVTAIYKLNGIDLTKIKAPMPTIGELYQHAFSQKLVYQSTKPAIGDLAFFHNTVDRNRDGRWNDWHTLVGIVESIDNDQTITILTYRTDKIERIQLNLKYPELQKGKKGQILNTQIRPDEAAQKGTSAKLFAGFANLLGNATSVTVIDNWTPGMKLSK